MTNIQKTGHQLPRPYANLLKRANTDTRNKYIAALRHVGWTLQSIADGVELSRERVSQIAKSTTLDMGMVDVVPKPPQVAVKKPREFVEPSPETLARLLELKPLAEKVRGKGMNYRAEGEEYSKLLWEAHKPVAEGGEGVPIYRLAKRLGVTHAAIRFRLARYKYKPPVSGTSKVYNTILDEHRLTE